MKKEFSFYNCPYCGKRVSVKYTFCIYCAKRLKGQNVDIDSAIKKAGSVEEFIEGNQISMF